MKKGKVNRSRLALILILWVSIVIIISILFPGCSPRARMERLIRNHPEELQTISIHSVDTARIPQEEFYVSFDSLFSNQDSSIFSIMDILPADSGCKLISKIWPLVPGGKVLYEDKRIKLEAKRLKFHNTKPLTFIYGSEKAISIPVTHDTTVKQIAPAKVPTPAEKAWTNVFWLVGIIAFVALCVVIAVIVNKIKLF